MPEGRSSKNCWRVSAAATACRTVTWKTAASTLRSEGGSHFALVSDSPSPDPPHFRTFSHGSGVNVLYQSGAVCFVTRPCASPESDHIFLNAAGEIGLGLNRYDAVIPPAGATPIMPVGLRW